MLLKTKKITLASEVKVSLPINSRPHRFINQGNKGIFLWYSDSGIDGLQEFTFRFVKKDESVDENWEDFGSLKEGSYMEVFRVP